MCASHRRLFLSVILTAISFQLSPTDDEMDNIGKKYEQNVSSRIAAAKISQLAMAAPLESSGSHYAKPRNTPATEGEKPQVKEPPPQKLGLLQGLLSLGALRPALALLSKFPRLVDSPPKTSDLLLRIIRHSLRPLYQLDWLQSDWLANLPKADFTTARPRFGPTGMAPAPEPKPQLCQIAPPPPSTSTIRSVFFYPRWTEHIPQCRTMHDLEDVLEPLMKFVGVQISRDPALMGELARLGRVYMGATV